MPIFWVYTDKMHVSCILNRIGYETNQKPNNLFFINTDETRIMKVSKK